MASRTNHENDPLVTIATFETELEASLARGALESIGIRALVPGETTTNISPYPAFAKTGLLQVFESDRDRAVTELRRLQIRVVGPFD